MRNGNVVIFSIPTSIKKHSVGGIQSAGRQGIGFELKESGEKLFLEVSPLTPSASLSVRAPLCYDNTIRAYGNLLRWCKKVNP